MYHVLKRGNGRAEVFPKPGDYQAFLRLLAEACDRLPMRLLAYCLMPNLFHLVLWPHEDGDLGRWMQWLLTSHVRRYHRHYHSSGHVWQGRFNSLLKNGDWLRLNPEKPWKFLCLPVPVPFFQQAVKAFPVQEDEHFLTVCRYVERNPLRAGLVRRAERWAWSSLSAGELVDEQGHSLNKKLALAAWPLRRPKDWLEWVNGVETAAQLAALRRRLERGAAFGDAAWAEKTAAALGLESSLRPRGRPKKAEK